MDLNLLTTFLTVYRCRSITQASEQLELTQPAVSAALKRLDAVVGKTLFVREGRGIAPTGAAVALAHKIESPLAILETVEKQNESFKVHCSESVLPLLINISDLIFSEAPLDEQEVFDDLVSQKVDLVVDVLISKRHSLVVEDVFSEDGVCLCREGHPRIGDSISLEEYYSEEHIALKIRRNELNTLDFLSDKPIEPRKIIVETSSITGMMMLAGETDYLAHAPRSLAELLAPKFGLKVLPIPMKLNRLNFRIIYHRRYLEDENHKNKREQIKAVLQSFQA